MVSSRSVNGPLVVMYVFPHFRYMSILHPLRALVPKGNVSVWFISGIWFFSLLLSIPNAIQTELFKTESGQMVCTTGMTKLHELIIAIHCTSILATQDSYSLNF